MKDEFEGVNPEPGKPAQQKKIKLPTYTGGTSGKETTACQRRRLKRHGFNSRVGKTTWSQPTPVFLFGEAHGQRILMDYGP